MSSGVSPASIPTPSLCSVGVWGSGEELWRGSADWVLPMSQFLIALEKSPGVVLRVENTTSSHVELGQRK